MTKFISPMDWPNWDKMVETYQQHTVFHSASWLRVLSECYHYSPLALLVGSDLERPEVIIPLVEVDSWLTGRRGVSLPFSDFCEPLLTGDDDSIREAESVLGTYGIQQGWKYVELRGSSYVAGSLSDSFLVHTLDLTLPEQKLFNCLSASTRRNIAKSVRLRVRLRLSTSAEAMAKFFSLHCRNRREHGLVPQPFPFFESIRHHLIEAGHGTIAEACLGEKVIASHIYLEFGSSVIYKYGASDSENLDPRPNNLIMWEMIRRYAERGFRSLSLGRTDPDNEGLDRYKTGWGAARKVLTYRRIYTGSSEARSRISDSPIAAVVAHMPTWMTKFVGQVAYRHFG